MFFNSLSNNENSLSKVLLSFLIGILIFFVSFFFLWQNEKNYVEELNVNKFILKNAKHIDSTSLNQENNNSLIYFTGIIQSNEDLEDEYKVKAENSLFLYRKVEIYQWLEKENRKKTKKPNGETVEEIFYTYHKDWVEGLVDSSNFVEKNHINPTNQTIYSKKLYSQNIKVGNYKIKQSQINLMRNKKIEILDNEDYSINFKDLNVKKHNSIYYISNNPSSPNIGDVRISYFYIPSNFDITIIGKQINNSITEYLINSPELTKEHSFFYFSNGSQTIETVIKILNSEINMKTWLMRGIFTFLMFIGLVLIFSPLHFLSSFIPILGGIFSGITTLISFFIALILSTATILIAYFRFRPILILYLVLIIIIFLAIKNKKEIKLK